jgi:signal transduction histidine kinase
MSLRLKIAIGVLAATAVLTAALAYLGLEAKAELDRVADAQREKVAARMEEYRRDVRANGMQTVQTFVRDWVEKQTGASEVNLPPLLRDPDNGFREAARIHRDGGELHVAHDKPVGSQATLSEEEAKAVDEVLASGEYRFIGPVLFLPFKRSFESSPGLVLRLHLNMAPLPSPDLPAPDPVNLRPLAAAAFSTLALAMLAVFVMLMFALRRFVLAPLGNVLEHSERIVKGAGGLEVRGLKPGKSGDIETLVTAFNAMFSELKAYQSDLEGKVKSATRTIRQQQQSLVIAQRLAATGTLAAGLAHEVNNPLSGMLNAARRLRQRDGLDERARDYIELIEEGLGRIENLMKQILDFSRRRDMKPERFPPQNALRRSLPLVRHRAEARKLKLEEDIAPDVPQVFGNEEEISQVLMNLLLNAIDAAPGEGSVRAGIAKAGDGGVIYTIEDSGPGVPEEIAGRIFDPFFTTKEPGKGTGLGLAIVHTIVDNHGGKIRVDRSTRLGGARFVVELPPADRSDATRKLLPPVDADAA